MPEGAGGAQPAVTAEMAGFIARTPFADIPADVIARGKVHMLDTLGVALAGARADTAALCRGYVAALGCRGEATVFGADLRTAPRFAAFLNGTSMHADNFDDTAPQAAATRNGGVHASATVLPAALALAEAGGLGGRAVSEAFHVGVEAMCKLNYAVDQRHYMSGWHVTSTLGAFGAAAAAARMLGLDSAGTAHALANVASRAAGLRANFGTMVEHTHSGMAAESGVVAADLASRGLTGATDILEADGGWFEACGGFDPAAICGRLGSPWTFAAPGMTIKPWPSGGMAHPAMTLLQNMMRTHGISGASVARLRVRPNRKIAAVLRHSRPQDAMQAKFSMPFCLALLLATGRAGLDAFTDEAVRRPDVAAMIERIEIDPYDAVEPGYTNLTTLMEIEMIDGTVHRGRADSALGGLDAPMSYADVAEKFAGCADFVGWPSARTAAIVDIVSQLEKLPDIRRLTALLAAD